MNAPEPHELYVAAEGEKKITFEKDPRVVSAGSFLITKEGHTVGNMIRAQLLRDPRVLFSGYKVAHPMTNDVVIRVQTKGMDYTPEKAFENAISDLINEISVLEENFKLQVQEKRESAENFY